MNPHLQDLFERLPRPEPRTSKVMGGLAVAALVVGLVVFVGVPRLFDGTRQGQAVANQIAQATGLRVLIGGKVEVSLWPHAHIGINNFSLVSLDGRTTHLKVPRLDLNVTLGSLMGGTYTVRDITLNQPEVMLQRAADGSWQGLPMPQQLQALSVREIKVEQGQVRLANGSSTETVSAVTGQIVLPDASSLLQTHLSGEWRGAPVQLMLDVAAPIGNDPSLTRLNVDVGAAETSFKIAGMVDFARPQWPLQGQLDLSAGQGAALWALLSSLGFAIPEPGDAALRAPLSVSALLGGDRNNLNFEGIKLALGDWKVEGLARYVAGRDGGVSVALKTDPVDLANWPTLLGWAQMGNMAIPQSWLGAFDVSMAGVSFAAYSATSVRLKGEIKNGTLALSEASALLPGNTKLSFSGQISTLPSVPASLDGKFALETVELRNLLGAYGMALPAAIDSGALNQLKLASDLHGSWRSLALANLDLLLDGMHITGQVSPRGSDGMFAANLAVEQLNLDRYAAADGLPGWIWALPPTNFNLRFGRLQAGDKSADNVSLQAIVANNLLTLKGLDAADFGGTRLRLSGTVSADASKDTDLTLQLVMPDFSVLRQSFPAALQLVPGPLADLISGNTDLSVRWRRTAGETQQLSSATYGDGKFDVVVTSRPQSPTNWKVRIQNRETASWLRNLAPAALQRADAVLGLLDVYAEGVAVDASRWHISAIQGQMAGMTFKGGDLTFTPGISAGTPWRAEGSLNIGQGSIDLWRQTVNPVALLGKGALALSLTAEKLMWAGKPLEDVVANLQFSPEGRLTLSQTQGRWNGGTFSLNGEAALAPDLMVKGTLELKETNITWQGGDRFGLSGVTDMSLRVDGQGRDLDTLIHSLSGDGDFSADSGALKGIDLAGLTEALLDKRGTADITSLLARGGTTVLSSFGGDFTIEEGVVRAPNLKLRTPVASADVSADLDLSGPRLDSSASISLRELTNAQPLVLRLSGPLDNVAPSFDSAAMAASLTRPQEQPAKPATDKPATDKPAAQAMGEAADKTESVQDKTADDTAEVKPPEMPSPPSLDEPVAEPVAIPVETPKQEAAPRRPNRSASTAASKPAAPANRAPTRANAVTQAPSPPGAPPSIQELLEAMPALQGAAQAAVSGAPVPAPNAAASAPVIETAPAPASSQGNRQAAQSAPPSPPAAAMPNISFTPAQPAPAGSKPGVAPEFAGQAPKATRDTAPAANATTMDVVGDEGDDGAPPPASVNELMGRVDGN